MNYWNTNQYEFDNTKKYQKSEILQIQLIIFKTAHVILRQICEIIQFWGEKEGNAITIYLTSFLFCFKFQLWHFHTWVTFSKGASVSLVEGLNYSGDTYLHAQLIESRHSCSYFLRPNSFWLFLLINSLISISLPRNSCFFFEFSAF